MTISRTLLIGSLTVSVISILLTAIIIATAGFLITQEEIENQTQNHLISIRDEQKDYLTSHLTDINNQIITYSNSLTIKSASKDFLTAFNYEARQEPTEVMTKTVLNFYQEEFFQRYAERNIEINLSPEQLFNAIDQPAKLLQYDFIANNPFPLGNKNALESLETKSLYGRIHQKYHPEIKSYLEAFAYYDIFIIDAETGRIIYSVFKEIDFATSLIDGPFKDTGLAKVFTEARDSSSKNSVTFSAFSSYTPSYEDPAAFIASPVLDDSGKTIAVLAFQMSINKINNIMTLKKQWSEKGMGDTGETYLVAENYKAQSVNRKLVENQSHYLSTLSDSKTDEKTINAIERKGTNIGFQEIKTHGVESALNGQSGFAIYPDYRGINVLGAYTPIEYQGSRFALIAEIEEQEAYSFKRRLVQSAIFNVLLVSVIITAIVAFIAWKFSTALSNQLNYAVKVAKGVARGEKVDIPDPKKQNEISQLMTALSKMQTEVIGKFEEAAAEAKCITSAVEAASTNIMMADGEYNIVYMNPSVKQMMLNVEKDLQQVLPDFKADNLIGKNIDIFHKNPDHQRQLLSRLTKTYQTSIKIGSRSFILIATPIYDDNKVRLGTVVEWSDKTAEVSIQEEVSNLISAANMGDLSKRLQVDKQEGFTLVISEGLNALLNKVSGFVDEIALLFESMSEGDLTKQISNTYEGELETIKDNANNSISKVNEVLSQITRASSLVLSSSNEVAQGADDLSRRTESQASTLEETSSSMEEITEAVNQTTNNASHSNKLAAEAKVKAEKGGQVVKEAVDAMSDIFQSSKKISDIIGVIDEIAFQTNLLALNAAVEAARAGEQGRGFAVVASEVRSLSQRSAAAAKEIKDLIRDSVNKVESGASLVNESGKILSEIVLSVDKVANMINEVSTASIEQNSGIMQINKAVNQMDELTQQNAALVEQTSAASRSMSEEASHMNRLISFFQLSNTSYENQQTKITDNPIKTYQQTSTYNKTSKPENKGAASFSNDDEWEDF